MKKKEPMEVREIIKTWLTEYGYDGLYDPGECGCIIEDLAPCGQISGGCIPGYVGVATVESGYDFTIGPPDCTQCQWGGKENICESLNGCKFTRMDDSTPETPHSA